MINRKDLCNVITSTLIEDIISAIDYAADDGWREEEGAKKLKAGVEKIGNICGIVINKQTYSTTIKS